MLIFTLIGAFFSTFVVVWYIMYLVGSKLPKLPEGTLGAFILMHVILFVPTAVIMIVGEIAYPFVTAFGFWTSWFLLFFSILYLIANSENIRNYFVNKRNG